MKNNIKKYINTIVNNKIFLISFIFIILSYIARIILISFTTLIDDEAHYALWTKHLPFGFFDHGPGIAFFIKLSMIIFGNTGFGVRFGSIVFSILVSIFIYIFLKKEKDENTAIISVILFNTVPFFAGLSLIVTIDTPMFYFLIFSIMAYYKAIYSNKKYFYLAGFLFGFSLLSKEGAIFVGASICLFTLISNKRKEIFLSKEFYLSFIVAALVYMPFIIYNFQTDFTFIKYALDRQLQKPGSINRTLDFWGAQIGLYSPLFFILFCYLIIKIFIDFLNKKEIENNLYFAFISLLPFIYILQKSFKNKLEVNWALFMYGGGLFLVSYYISKNWNKKYIRNLFLANVLFCNIAIFIVILQYFMPIIPIKGDPTDRYYKYNAIRYDLKDYYDSNMDKNIRMFGLNYQIPSMINFYIDTEKEAVCLNWNTYHPTVFDFWYKDNDFIGNDFYHITTSSDTNLISQYFDNVEYITNFQSYRKNLNGEIRYLDNYYIFLCKNYHGKGTDYIYKSEKIQF
ncbi:glycosyl transferase family 39 [Brachyspira pilosicoli B2904]|uniref:Glycosyl transferase family 39 n=1 Tax=Brachyspira pilosicoli B2904 TaxID=1133568 RepID=J9TWF5_BRAPL|nr:glycosyltransferase family 39 protein [Brachyspira pilosicoli]AFR70662.1 glycosyl transferase family 39 [Brachyspira pilosicoli B2904]